MLRVANGELIARAIPRRAARDPRRASGTCSGGSSPSARRRSSRSARALGGLVQRRGQPAAGVARERVVDAELVEHGDHDAAEVVLVAVGARDRVDEQVERALGVAGVERREGRRRGRRRPRLLEADAGGEAVGVEAPGDVRRAGLERLVALAARGAAGSAERRRRRRRGRARARARGAATPRRPRRRARRPRWARAPSKKRSTCGGRLRADELVDDAAVLERLDGGDALDPERRGDAAGWRRCRAWRARPCPRARRPPSRAPARARGTGRTTRPRSRRRRGSRASAR